LSGGAVSVYTSGKTLTLTGNLFYGNTSVSGYPVVYDYGGIVSASYNVVDVPFGTGSAQCGWLQEIGDTLVTGLPISGKTFKLLLGSGATGVITTLPVGYPATDFYGASISNAAAAGAVQASTTGNGYYLELLANNSLAGTVEVSGTDGDGLVSGSFTITASPNPGYVLVHWLVNGVETTSAPISISGHTSVQAVFNRIVTVNIFTDGTGSETTPGTLRYALTNADDGDVSSFSGVTAGTTVVELESALPEVTKSITLAGNGITLTRDASWTTSPIYAGLVHINCSTAEVKISGVHFKDGWATYYGGAICTTGTLTLESCIFSGNQNTYGGYGGAIYSENTLTIRSCTFYGNSSSLRGGAVYFVASGKTLTLTGNLFYGNTAPNYPVVYNYDGTVNASYNVVDVAYGASWTQCGWTQGTWDMPLTTLPISPITFRLLSGSEASGTITTLPSDYPTTDFYGQPINANAAAGAVQGSTTGYYLDLSVNNSLAGTVGVLPLPNEDGLVSGSFTITATPNPGYTFGYWLVNGVPSASVPTSISGHTSVQAVFNRTVTVNTFTDGLGVQLHRAPCATP
jgi:hypothetical protein